MASKQKTIYVYDDFSFDKTSLMGCLWVDVLKGEESYSFEFDRIWKRIVFNMAVSNTDDHLRNHAFILAKNGWHFHLFMM